MDLKPWPNALDFSLCNARHSCIVKCRERLATLYSEVECVLLCIVKFDQSQIFGRCRVLSRAFGHPLSTTLYIARQHYTFIEQCIVKSRERLARALVTKRAFIQKTLC